MNRLFDAGYNSLVRKIILVLIVLAVLLPIAFLAMRSATPVIDLPSPIAILGQATPIAVRVRDPRGIRKLSAFVEQNGARYSVWELPQPSSAAESTLKFTAGVKTTPQLKNGKAKLIVEATSNDLLGKIGRLEAEVTVVTQPPAVSADSEQHY